jgi:hypothetical protein
MTSSLSHAWVRDSEVVKRDMAQEWYVVGGRILVTCTVSELYMKQNTAKGRLNP